MTNKEARLTGKIEGTRPEEFSNSHEQKIEWQMSELPRIECVCGWTVIEVTCRALRQIFGQKN